jgi:hypothetical protein
MSGVEARLSLNSHEIPQLNQTNTLSTKQSFYTLPPPTVSPSVPSLRHGGRLIFLKKNPRLASELFLRVYGFKFQLCHLLATVTLHVI